LRTPLQQKIIIGNFDRKVILYEFAAQPGKKPNRLPYLWAVFKGDISFVGKEMVALNEAEAPSDYYKLDLKPGLTGLAQVNRGRQLSMEEKDKYHLYYFKNYSLLLDIEIILKALFKI
jgi:lipopolysaccharide/colanic/teichoic acid biosynthesis glycosyltransferase